MQHLPSRFSNEDNHVGVIVPIKAERNPTKKNRKDSAVKVPRKNATAKSLVKPEGPHSESSSGSASDSEYDSDELEIEMPEPSPIPDERPLDLVGMTKYETLKAVWSPRNRQPAAVEIRDAARSFSEVVKGVRDTWKASSEALKTAETKKQEATIPGLMKDAAKQRQMMELVLETTMESGHPAFIERYVQCLFLALNVTFLVSRRQHHSVSTRFAVCIYVRGTIDDRFVHHINRCNKQDSSNGRLKCPHGISQGRFKPSPRTELHNQGAKKPPRLLHPTL